MMPDCTQKSGRRDFALLMILYDAALRAEELTGLKVGDIQLTRTPTVRISGKGGKTRIVPITKTTADSLLNYMKENDLEGQPTRLLFVNGSGNGMTRMGITYILKKYAESAELPMTFVPSEKISPHVMRRSKATHLIQSGVNIYYIRDFLGHCSISTTERYLRNDPETTRRSIEKASSSIDLPGDSFYSKERKYDMMEFLKSFKRH